MEQHNSQTGKGDISPVSKDIQTNDEVIIPVIEEKLIVGKQSVETGKVSISKKIIEETSFINQQLISEQVAVIRKEINQYVDTAPPAVRQEGDVTIISVVKEVLVVEKRLMLVEELHITKQKTEVNEQQEVTLRREHIEITRNASGTEI